MVRFIVPDDGFYRERVAQDEINFRIACSFEQLQFSKTSVKVLFTSEIVR